MSQLSLVASAADDAVVVELSVIQRKCLSISSSVEYILGSKKSSSSLLSAFFFVRQLLFFVIMLQCVPM